MSFSPDPHIYNTKPARAALNPVNNPSTNSSTTVRRSLTTTSSASNKLLNAVVNGAAMPSAAVSPNDAITLFNAVEMSVSKVVMSSPRAVELVACRIESRWGARALAWEVAALTAETIWATEAEMADWASDFSVVVEVEVIVAAVDS